MLLASCWAVTEGKARSVALAVGMASPRLCHGENPVEGPWVFFLGGSERVACLEGALKAGKCHESIGYKRRKKRTGCSK